jgi:hypothetical protein
MDELHPVEAGAIGLPVGRRKPAAKVREFARARVVFWVRTLAHRGCAPARLAAIVAENEAKLRIREWMRGQR